jgi:hypothetical protein
MRLTLILWLLTVLIPGWLVVVLWFDEISRGFFKKISLAYGLGLALLTVEIFLIVFIFRLPVKWLYPVLMVEILAGGLQYWRRFGFDFRQRFKAEKKRITWTESLLLLLIVWQIATAGLAAWLNPVINWDSITVWSFKAKALLYNLQGFFDPGSSWFWHNQNMANYPWLVPLAQYWLALINKGFDEVLVNFIFVGFLAALICFFYGYLRNYLNRGLSLLLVWLLATTPLIAYHAYNAYADLPLAFYAGAAFVLTYKWLDTANNKYLTLSWLCLAAALFTKNEAIIFIIAQLLILLIAKSSLKIKWTAIFASLVPAVIAAIPWLGWKIFYKLPTSNVAGGLGWHGQVLAKFLEDMFVAASWNIWWYIFFGLSLLFIGRIMKDRSLRLAYGLWCLSLGGLLILYLFTAEYQFAIDGTALSRNLINFVPGSAWLLGLLWRREFFAGLFTKG